ncbi:MAG: 50S ribosomal protein L10 [Spirochaetales bacterium]|nr:50S ribosomal protein L10 [Spirochaetales bacterium]
MAELEHKTRINEDKEKAVEQLRSEFSNYSGFFFAEYRGMTVEEITELRRQLRKNNSVCRVVKNRFAKIALKELNHEGLDACLKGPTAMILANGENEGPAAKAMFACAKASGKLVVKGSYIDGKVYDAAQTEAFSKLPTKPELISILMGTMKAPVQKLAATLLAYVEKLEGKEN